VQGCVFTRLRVSAARLASVGRALHPLPRAFMRASTANLIKCIEPLRMICISERYRSPAQHVCEPRHACAPCPQSRTALRSIEERICNA
jgi:hypothetical protein